jgi:hypothetical protein
MRRASMLGRAEHLAAKDDVVTRPIDDAIN